MPNKSHKLILIFFPAIFLLIIQADCYASEAQDAANSALQVSNKISNELTPPGQNAGPQPPYIQFQSIWDIYEALALLSGVILSALGLAIIALSFLRWKKKDLLLISTGVFCFLYGARSRAFLFIFQPSPEIWDYAEWFITYLVLISAFFFVEQLLGKGWKSSIRLLWQISIVFAILAIAAGIYLRNPAAASTINNIWAGTALVVILINLFRPSLLPKMELRVIRFGFLVLALFSFHANFAHYVIKGPLGRNYEPIGLVVLFCCLGYLVANRFFQNEKELITLAHELETARQIQSFILPQEMEKIPHIDITARYVPMATMAGDFYDFLIIDEKHVGMLVADVSGHGVPASLIASMVKIAFVSQRPYASDPSRVLSGINQILCGKLESDFVTAGYLYIDMEQKSAFYAGGGHPPLLVWQPSVQKVVEYQNKSIILGHIEEAQYETIRLDFESGDRFILYTDGIVEASNQAGDLFGWEQFKAFISSNGQLSGNDFADKLIKAVSDWSGKGAKDNLDDDLTLIVIDCEDLGNEIT